VHFLSGSYFIFLISLLFIGSFFSGLLLYWLFVDSRQVLDAKRAEALGKQGKQGKQIGEESIKQTLGIHHSPHRRNFWEICLTELMNLSRRTNSRGWNW